MGSNELYQIDGGDGDQDYFSEPINLKVVEPSWFPGSIPDFGIAMLFVVCGGKHANEYLALTPRGGFNLAETLQIRGHALAIAFRVTNPTPSYDGTSEKDLKGVGLAYVKRV